MNDLDLYYHHYARREELIKQADNERKARELINAAKATRRGGRNVRHDGIAARVAKAFGRRAHHDDAGDSGPGRAHPAK
jgi:hypothetical protein